MALVPKDLMEQIEELENLFSISAEMMNTIVDRFASELEKGLNPYQLGLTSTGLSVHGGSIVSKTLL